MDITLRSPAKIKYSSALSKLVASPLLLAQWVWVRLCRPNSRHPEWVDTVAEQRPVCKAPKPLRRPVDALTRAFDKLPAGRKGARHLHIVEQTLQLTGGSLDDIPLYVLKKAVLQLRVLTSGTRNPSLRQLEQDLKNQIFRTDLRAYIDSTRGSITWASGAGSIASERGEIYIGEFVDTSRMPIDVPLAFAATCPLGLVETQRETRNA